MPPLDFGSGNNQPGTAVDAAAEQPGVKPGDQPPAAEQPGDQPRAQPAAEAPALPDPFKANADKLAPTAESLVGKNLTQGPAGYGFPPIPKAKGCAASVSNVLIKDGQIPPKDFQFNVDDLESMLKTKGATVVDAAHLQKGDIIVGRDEKDNSGGRHVGIVDVNDKGQLVALNNNDGVFGSSDLQSRFFAKYGEVYGLRLPQS
jgi:hypothetical protein